MYIEIDDSLIDDAINSTLEDYLSREIDTDQYVSEWLDEHMPSEDKICVWVRQDITDLIKHNHTNQAKEIQELRERITELERCVIKRRWFNWR